MSHVVYKAILQCHDSKWCEFVFRLFFLSSHCCCCILKPPTHFLVEFNFSYLRWKFQNFPRFHSATCFKYTFTLENAIPLTKETPNILRKKWMRSLRAIREPCSVTMLTTFCIWDPIWGSFPNLIQRNVYIHANPVLNSLFYGRLNILKQFFCLTFNMPKFKLTNTTQHHTAKGQIQLKT